MLPENQLILQKSVKSKPKGSILRKTRRYGASVQFGVVVVELINCKCGGTVGNQIW